MMKTVIASLLLTMGLMAGGAWGAEKGHVPHVDLDLGMGAVEKGRQVFEEQCSSCHGMKFMGYKATMDAELAVQSFGVEPPDLSLIAKARGKRTAGAQYIYALLTSYYVTDDGRTDNKIFPNIAMPNLGVTDEDARAVTAFLYYASEPSRADRFALGKWVVGYLAILSMMLYVVNKRVWKDIKKKPE